MTLFSGLMRDDIIRETPEVEEAIRRLPKDVYDQRIFRISRALNLSAKKNILPREQWTKIEDVQNFCNFKPFKKIIFFNP